MYYHYQFVSDSHGSYNLQKVLNFSSCLEKFFEFGLGPWKVLIDFLIRSWKVLEIHYLVYTRHPFSVKLGFSAEENLAHYNSWV